MAYDLADVILASIDAGYRIELSASPLAGGHDLHVATYLYVAGGGHLTSTFVLRRDELYAADSTAALAAVLDRQRHAITLRRAEP